MDGKPFVGLEAEVASGGGHDRGRDFNADEVGAGQVVVERGSEASAAQSAEEDGLGGWLPEQGKNHRLRVGALEAKGEAEVHRALNPVGVGRFGVQHPKDEALAFAGDGDVVFAPFLGIEGRLAAFNPELGVSAQAVFVGLLPDVDGFAFSRAGSVHGLARSPSGGLKLQVEGVSSLLLLGILPGQRDAEYEFSCKNGGC